MFRMFAINLWSSHLASGPVLLAFCTSIFSTALRLPVLAAITRSWSLPIPVARKSLPQAAVAAFAVVSSSSFTRFRRSPTDFRAQSYARPVPRPRFCHRSSFRFIFYVFRVSLRYSYYHTRTSARAHTHTHRKRTITQTRRPIDRKEPHRRSGGGVVARGVSLPVGQLLEPPPPPPRNR